MPASRPNSRQRREVRENCNTKAERQHNGREDDDRADVVHGPHQRLAGIDRARAALLELEAIEEVDRTVDRQRERHRDRDDRGELKPLAIDPQQRPGREDREQRRQDAGHPRQHRPQGDAEENEDHEHVPDQPPVELADEARRVAGGDRGKPGHRDLVAGMGRAHGIERLVDLLDDREDPAGVDIGEPPGHQDGVLILVDEALHQMLGQDARCIS